MKTIIAIGGGEIGRPGTKIETEKIDKEILARTRKKNPKLLFIPTASSDSLEYCKVVEKYFGKRLGARVEFLLLLDKKIKKSEITKKIEAADVIYVGGGNTLKMMKTWRKLGVDELLKEAHEQGKILSGVSAGAICWFKYGNSDSRKFNNKNASLMRVSGLNFINALFCPHYNVEVDRPKGVKKMMKRTPGIALCLDNCTALEVQGHKFRILKSNKTSKAYVCYWKKGNYKEIELKNTKFKNINDILDTANI